MSKYTVSITKQQLSELPSVVFNGRINVVERLDQALEALEFLSMQETVGFDTETRPSFRKGQTNKVALMQISTAERCFLFRINKLGFIEPLKQFLENPNVTKIGLSLKDDFLVLRKLTEFQPAGFIDLQQLVKDYEITDCSLQKIYGIIFGERISKSQRLSNWEAPALTPAQQSYAAIDAWACLQIYRNLNAKQFNPVTSPYLVTETYN